MASFLNPSPSKRSGTKFQLDCSTKSKVIKERMMISSKFLPCQWEKRSKKGLGSSICISRTAGSFTWNLILKFLIWIQGCIPKISRIWEDGWHDLFDFMWNDRYEDFNDVVHFFCFDHKYPSRVNLVQKFKVVCSKSNLIQRLIRICRIQWWCQFYLS